ncbi:hypothetical protein V8E36_003672 [Tilletia maclaganii]
MVGTRGVRNNPETGEEEFATGWKYTYEPASHFSDKQMLRVQRAFHLVYQGEDGASSDPNTGELFAEENDQGEEIYPMERLYGLSDEELKTYWMLHRELKAGATDMGPAAVNAWAATEALSQLDSIEETAMATAKAAAAAATAARRRIEDWNARTETDSSSSGTGSRSPSAYPAQSSPRGPDGGTAREACRPVEGQSPSLVPPTEWSELERNQPAGEVSQRRLECRHPVNVEDSADSQRLSKPEY